MKYRALLTLSASIALLFASSPAMAQNVSGGLKCELQITRDLVYGFGKMEKTRGSKEAVLVPLTLDAYIPKTCNGVAVKDLPVIGAIHGGGFVKGTKERMTQMALYLSENFGYAVFSINYRLDSEKGPRPILSDVGASNLNRNELYKLYPTNVGVIAAVEDSIAAKDFVFGRQKEFKIDTNKFGLIGYSAGAVTSLNMAAASDNWGLGDHKVKAVIDVAGGMDVTLIDQNDMQGLMIVHGRNDTTAPFVLAEALNVQARKAGINTEFLRLDTGHSVMPFKTVVPGTDKILAQRFGEFFGESFAKVDRKLAQLDTKP